MEDILIAVVEILGDMFDGCNSWQGFVLRLLLILIVIGITSCNRHRRNRHQRCSRFLRFYTRSTKSYIEWPFRKIFLKTKIH